MVLADLRPWSSARPPLPRQPGNEPVGNLERAGTARERADGVVEHVTEATT